MGYNRRQLLKRPTAALKRPPTASRRRTAGGATFGKRSRGARQDRLPFSPPEDWHEPTGAQGYRFIVQPPGEGYRHVVTVEEVRGRLEQLPSRFVEPLEVVQFSQVTRKKKSYACYGMQWGAAVYLYPIEEDLVEYFPGAPEPAQYNEARMYGGRWVQEGPCWRLEWNERTIADFYLNNILIHELGHLLDDRNSSYRDRERYAEWFALRWGYRPTQRLRQEGKPRPVVRRHHGV